MLNARVRLLWGLKRTSDVQACPRLGQELAFREKVQEAPNALGAASARRSARITALGPKERGHLPPSLCSRLLVRFNFHYYKTRSWSLMQANTPLIALGIGGGALLFFIILSGEHALPPRRQEYRFSWRRRGARSPALRGGAVA